MCHNWCLPTRRQIKRNPPWHQALAPMRLPTIARRDALSFALASSLLTAFPDRPAFAADGVATNFGETAEELEGAMGGLKPGTGRPLNALIKMRAETGID